jgi:hypothetical protein
MEWSQVGASVTSRRATWAATAESLSLRLAESSTWSTTTKNWTRSAESLAP